MAMIDDAKCEICNVWPIKRKGILKKILFRSDLIKTPYLHMLSECSKHRHNEFGYGKLGGRHGAAGFYESKMYSGD